MAWFDERAGGEKGGCAVAKSGMMRADGREVGIVEDEVEDCGLVMWADIGD